MDTTLLNNIHESVWKKLSTKKIYFGHQSVGSNIIEGINEVMNNNAQIKLNIVETTNPDDFNQPIFAHSCIGQNMNPYSKCDAFRNLLLAGIGDKVDIAFFKFCYVDINHDTDVQNLFKYYKTTIATLTAIYPHLTLVHVTVPLMADPNSLKTRLKRFIHYPIQRDQDNIKRNEFNNLLLKEYDGKQPLFNLAKIESTFPDGTYCYFKSANIPYASLVPEYTNDGGHLNEHGRRVTAEQLLAFLANLVK